MTVRPLLPIISTHHDKKKARRRLLRFERAHILRPDGKTPSVNNQKGKLQ